MNKAAIVFERLMQLKKLSNLEELADFLNINYGTLRNQKSRGKIPYESIVSKCDSVELAYVLKGEVIKEEFAEASEPRVHYKGDEPAYKEIKRRNYKLETELSELKSQIKILKDLILEMKK